MKILNFFVVLLLTSTIYTACSKKSDADSPQQEEPVNLTHYYIAGKFTEELNGKTYSLPYAILLKPNAQAILLRGSSLDGGAGSYQLKDGNLLIDLEGNALVFTFTNNTITGYVGKLNLTSYDLEKIPATNAFTGKYRGSLKWTNNPLTNILTLLSFTDSKFAFGGSFNYPEPDQAYSVQNNAVGTGNISTSANPSLPLFVFIKGKLETSAYWPIKREFSYGSFDKQ